MEPPRLCLEDYLLELEFGWPVDSLVQILRQRIAVAPELS
jgi:hypothetical protein